MKSLGYNPMRWDCDNQGCFNAKMRPKIEVFHDCFPGRINFSDIDGIVEISGNALALEWKSAPMEITRGQEIMHKRLTRGKRFSVLCVAGNAETMEISHRATFYGGKWYPWEPATMEGIKKSLVKWAVWARKNPRIA